MALADRAGKLPCLETNRTVPHINCAAGRLPLYLYSKHNPFVKHTFRICLAIQTHLNSVIVLDSATSTPALLCQMYFRGAVGLMKMQKVLQVQELKVKYGIFHVDVQSLLMVNVVN